MHYTNSNLMPLDHYSSKYFPLFLTEGSPRTTFFPREVGLLISISARMGSIAENATGGWYSNWASKATQNQITQSLADFGTGNGAFVLGYHPGTVVTALSGDIGSGKQMEPARGTFTREEAVKKTMNVLPRAKKSWSGQVMDWQGNQVP
jgi:NAD(P)-dependent dehydrogenase (short-subunit alcohol dehydrogenase family)